MVRYLHSTRISYRAAYYKGVSILDFLTGVIILVTSFFMFGMIYFMVQNNENERKVKEYEQKEKDENNF